MTFEDAQPATDAAETAATLETLEADDYPVGTLASPTRIRL